MVARVPWEHEAQFESDVFDRGIYYQMEDGRAHNPEVAGSSPAPATHIKKKGNEDNATCSDKDTI